MRKTLLTPRRSPAPPSRPPASPGAQNPVLIAKVGLHNAYTISLRTAEREARPVDPRGHVLDRRPRLLEAPQLRARLADREQAAVHRRHPLGRHEDVHGDAHAGHLRVRLLGALPDDERDVRRHVAARKRCQAPLTRCLAPGTCLLQLDAGACLFELGLDRVGLFLVHALLDRGRGRVDEVLRLLQAEAGDRADDLDDADLRLAPEFVRTTSKVDFSSAASPPPPQPRGPRPRPERRR